VGYASLQKFKSKHVYNQPSNQGLGAELELVYSIAENYRHPI